MKQLLLFLSIVLTAFPLFAQDTTGKKKSATPAAFNRKVFFTQQDPLEITLVSDFKRISFNGFEEMCIKLLFVNFQSSKA